MADTNSDISRKTLRVGKYSLHLPENRFARMGIGVLLICGGILGFLPVLGFWMIPLGLLVLSFDIPALARFRKKLVMRWKANQAKKASREAAPPAPPAKSDPDSR